MSANPSETSPASRLDGATVGLLILPPLVWAGNSVLGRVVADMVPPITLNFFRWLVAFVLLLPWSYPVLKPQSPIWGQWRRYGLMSLLGVGCYNSLQYLALHTSTPINVTLVAASVPIFMLACTRIGAILVNLNPAYRTAELEYALNKSGCRVLIMAQAHRASNYVAMLGYERAEELIGRPYLDMLPPHLRRLPDQLRMMDALRWMLGS